MKSRKTLHMFDLVMPPLHVVNVANTYKFVHFRQDIKHKGLINYVT